MANIIIGALFVATLVWAGKRTHASIKTNSCPGCSSVCSNAQKEQCHK